MRLRQTLSASAFALFAATANAQTGVAPVLSLNQETYEPGDKIMLTYGGTTGDVAFLLINSLPGQFDFPGLGTLGLAVDANLSVTNLGLVPDTGELTAQCSVGCFSPLLEVPCFLQGVSVDLNQLAFRPPSNVEVLSFAGGDCGVCVDEAINDPDVKSKASVHALWLPGIGTDFAFVAGGDFVERADGTARLTGVVASLSDEDEIFEVDVLLSGRVNPGDITHPPLNSPKLELSNSAYAPAGSVEPATWHYYETTEGILTGRGDYEGGLLRITRRGPAFQVGAGANGKNLNYGGSGWLDVEVLSDPAGSTFESNGKGDFNLDLSRECVDCATAAEDHALVLKGIAKDMLFVQGGEFIERADGTAVLRGVVEHVGEPDLRWQVDVLFSGRINPGSVAHPPANSPKLELNGSNYADNGGSIDPSLWHYYETTEGTLTGVGGNEGAQIQLTRKGPAFQVGLGASGKNTNFGASGWLMYEVVSQPNGGAGYQDNGTGDFNLDLTSECPPEEQD